MDSGPHCGVTGNEIVDQEGSMHGPKPASSAFASKVQERRRGGNKNRMDRLLKSRPSRQTYFHPSEGTNQPLFCRDLPKKTATFATRAWIEHTCHRAISSPPCPGQFLDLQSIPSRKENLKSTSFSNVQQKCGQGGPEVGLVKRMSQILEDRRFWAQTAVAYSECQDHLALDIEKRKKWGHLLFSKMLNFNFW